MHHVAIIKKSWGLIPKILSGEKTIESRWYQTRRAPWDRIAAGDTVFFKNGGEQVTARAEVASVVQIEIRNLAHARELVRDYADAICMVNRNAATWKPLPRYCVLVTLRNPRAAPPFAINKAGFGGPAAWLTVPNIAAIRVSKS